MTSSSIPSSAIHTDFYTGLYKPDNGDGVIAKYFDNFAILSKAEQWEKIISQGSVVLEVAEKHYRFSDGAKICAQITSTCYYMGKYGQGLDYAIRCQELAKKADDTALFIRGSYLESAIHRALAPKQATEIEQQKSYEAAVSCCEDALMKYQDLKDEDFNLKGKVYFNLGAAHADNPKGDLEEAKRCYGNAVECFIAAKAAIDCIRTNTRFGKVYLLEGSFDQCDCKIKEVRAAITAQASTEEPCQRLSMHADYLEAQFKQAVAKKDIEAYHRKEVGLDKAKEAEKNIKEAIAIAQNGSRRAEELKAAEDRDRFTILLYYSSELERDIEYSLPFLI
jgi:hypothetical protein